MWQRLRRIIFAAGCLCTLVICSMNLIRYFSDAWRTEQQQETFQELRAAPTDAPEMDRISSVIGQFTVTFPRAEAAEAATAAPVLQNWPDNPSMTVSTSFQMLRGSNQDIVGWLSIPGMLEQPVVQRDNTYYLKRDSDGYQNENGALFLDERISLQTRPDTYLIFGHNMKTGEMFGSLRLYENLTYYRNNPILDFDVLYENGRYVIFAIADIDIICGLSHYAPFMLLPGMAAEEREACLQKLQAWSQIDTRVKVSAEDQLLLLITCEGMDESRRVVAARRLREGENEATIASVVQYAWKRE